MSFMLNRVANFQHSLNTSARSIKSLVGVLQLNSNKNLEANFETTQSFVEACVQRGAKLVCLPDKFAFQATSQGSWHENPLTGEWFKRYTKLAHENHVWLSLGGFPEQHPTQKDNYWTTHFIVNSEGYVFSKYRKMHIFSAELSKQGGIDVQENKNHLKGNEIVDPCFSPVGYLGLSNSYDIRFPELYRKLVLRGAQVMLIPSAFTAKTGASHWETLMRARAIEN